MSVKSTFTVKQLTVTAMLMALNIAFSTFSLPVPGGHLYLNDVVICTAAILLDPFPAFLMGGVGAFIGDLLFYPTPMFVSLVTHGLQAVIISLCCRRLMPQKREGLFGAIIGVAVGAVIMVAGYSFGRAFIYANPATALLQLPYQILQAAVGAVAGVILCYPCRLRRVYRRLMRL